MAAPNFNNRTLYHMDNLDVLRGMNSESIHLIATDPPFNKGRDFHATPDSLAAGARFQDRWKWDNDVHPDWVDKIQDDWPAVWSVIEASRVSWGDDMAAFLCFMGVRLMEMRRVLRPDGSIYLHCDPTASHYLKALMDAILGRRNFRTEITWQRTETHNTGNYYGNIADIILFYTKSDKSTWNRQFHQYDDGNQRYSEEFLKRFRYIDDNGRRYRVDNLTAPRPDSNSGKFTWRGTTPGPTRGWGYRFEQLEQWWAEGRIHTKRDGTPRLDGLKIYLDESKGKPLQNIWNDVKRIPNTSHERTGYPTQKPLALYERIIQASSNEGDWVLDPFAGCATTPIAAERLGRRWVGIDIWDKAHPTVLERLEKEGLAVPQSDAEQPNLLTFGDVYYSSAPPVRSDDEGESIPYLRLRAAVQEPPGPKMSRAEMFERLIEEWGLVCRGCNRLFDDPLYLQLDHNTPRSDGGLNHISNRMLLCGPCNRIKSNTLTLSGLRRENARRGRMAKR